MTRVVVVGGGMVGSRFAEELLRGDAAGRFEVTVLGEEPGQPYNRVLLSDVVAGRYDEGGVALPLVAHERLHHQASTEVEHIDRLDRLVVTTAGTRHRYDVLVLATGAAARIPPIPGLTPGVAGVHPMRSIEDARSVLEAATTARRVTVLGGGVLGIELATGLRRRGLEVSLVHPVDRVMERQLDDEAGAVLAGGLASLGIDTHLGTGAEEVLTTERPGGPCLTGLRLSDGTVLATDLLVLATGTAPRTRLAAAAGLPVERGIVVDHHLRSPADARVIAIGDCAQPPEGGTGLVAQGWQQAQRVATQLLGGAVGRAPADPPSTSAAGDDGSDVVRVKAHGLDVVTMGVTGAGTAGRRVTLSDPDIGRHLEVRVDQGRLLGATCIGAPQLAADLVVAYTRRTPLPRDPAHLLVTALAGESAVATSVVELPDDATVCRCSSVSKGAICAAIHDGATSVTAVAERTRASTGCGSCRADVCALLEALTAQSVTA